MIITGIDFLLLPVFIFMLSMIVMIRARKYNGTLLRKYLINMFLIHLLGSLLHSIVLQYYYGSGDAFGYFQGGEFIKGAVLHSGHGLNIFFMPGNELYDLPNSADYGAYVQNSLLTSSSLSIIKITGFLSFLSFSHFLINALFCGFISFIGMWKLFHVFNDISKGKFERPLVLFMTLTPTIWFWGSGLGKDSVSIGLTGIFVSCIYNIFKGKNIILNIAGMLLSCMILYYLKLTLLGIIAASALGYVAVLIVNKTKNIVLRFVTVVFFLAGFVFFFINSLDSIQSSLDEIQLLVDTNMAQYANVEEGSEGGFEPPEFTLSTTGIISAIPKTVFSTLYRPFIWEVRKPIMLLSALESLLMFLGLIYVIIKGGLFHFFKVLMKSPAALFCFIFCTLLGMIVGFTTFNLGTLVRYRLPLLPFYLFLLLTVLQSAKDKKLARHQAGKISV